MTERRTIKAVIQATTRKSAEQSEMTKSNWMMIAVAVLVVIAGGYLMMAPDNFWSGFATGGKMYADATDPDQVATGRRVYAEQCAECHGVRREGQPNWRRPKPRGSMPQQS